MKTSKKKQGKCRIELKVELDAAEKGEVVKSVEREFMRHAELPGFRKGKVPIEVIRKNFAGALRQETVAAMVRKFHPEALKAEGVDEVSLVGVKEFDLDGEGGSYTAVVDVRPEFKLPTYKGLKIADADATVKDSEVDERIDQLRAAYATFEDGKEGDAAAEGDYVQIDYEGTVGGKKILEVNPEAKIVAEGKGFWTQLEEGRFLPEILDAVKGMKAGETKEKVTAKFAKEGAPEGLAGAKAVYTVTLKMLRRRVLPDDATLAEKAKAESFEKLKSTVRESMERAKVEGEKRRREDEAVELLLKKVDFDVPQTQVDSVMQGMLSEMAQRAQLSGLDASYFEQNAEKIRKDAAEGAERQVRLWYVIEAIAKAEKIEADDKEIGRKVVEFVLANAKK